MKQLILGLITLVFLVILAPVFAFSLVAPLAMQSILLYWTSFVALAGLVGGGAAFWAYLESR